MAKIVNLKNCKIDGCKYEMAESIGSHFCASCTVNSIRRFAMVKGDNSLDNMTIEKVLFWFSIIKKDWKKLAGLECKNINTKGYSDEEYP